MKKALTTLLLVMAISSCSSYLDRGGNIHTDYMEFNYMENYNEFIYKSKVNFKADNEIYYKNHFLINLPKKIKNWQISDNLFYFEYDGKEIIYINSGYKNEATVGIWKVSETNNEEIYNKLQSYWDKRKYNEVTLKAGEVDRVSKVYSDGKVFILLYNIKQENFEKYMDLLKSFKYLNYDVNG